MAKSKKEIEKIVLEQTNFVPHNEKFAKSAEFDRLVKLFGENKVKLIHASAQRRIEILR